MTRLTDTLTALPGRLAAKPAAARRTLATAQDLAAAAWHEADAAGRDAVTLDDLLVAFALVGGPVGRTLAAHGLTAEALRAGVRERDTADLAALGITPPPSTEPVRVPGRLDPRRSFRMDPEAARFLEKATGSPAALLIGLADHPSGRPAAALRAAGADLPGLRAALADLGDAQAEDNAPAAPIPGLLDGLRETTRRGRRWVPVSAEAVGAVVGDAEAMRPLLFPDAETAGQDVRVAPGLLASSLKGRPFEHRLVRDGEVDGGREVVWQMFWPEGVRPRGEDGDPRGAYLHARIEPAEGGSVLTLTRGVRGFGRLGGLVAPLMAVFGGSGHRGMVRGILEQARRG